ncbi:protein YhfH, partial [Peribacillus simplex]|nr:protein YhfH [Peribacillus simplex]
KNPLEFFSECGTHIIEQAESYLLECDRCLSKKDEY